MIKKMNNKPEEILLVSGVKQVGDAISLNRERVSLTILGMANSDTAIATDKFNQFTEDGLITDEEKPSLRREMDSLERDFYQLRRNAGENGLGDSEEYLTYESDYNRLYSLLNKIVNSTGTYGAQDVADIQPYYEQYTQSATALSTKILEIQNTNAEISNYYARTVVGVRIEPEAVLRNSSTTISASVMYEGVEQINNPSMLASYIAFGLTGLATDHTVQSSEFTIPAGGSISINNTNHTASITNCKSFQMNYTAISYDGVDVACTVTLDSDSMPF